MIKFFLMILHTRREKINFYLILVVLLSLSFYTYIFETFKKQKSAVNIRFYIELTTNENDSSSYLTYIYDKNITDNNMPNKNITAFELTYNDDNANLSNDGLINEPSHTHKCSLLTLNEWDPTISKLFRKSRFPFRCIQNRPLSYVDENNMLRIDQEINRKFYNGKANTCEYAYVKRNTLRDDNYTLDDYKPLTSSVKVENEYVKVRCMVDNSSMSIVEYRKYQTLRKNKTFVKNMVLVYEYVHYVLLERKFDSLKVKLTNGENNGEAKKFNVMILVFDGVSLSSMKRALPKTLKYLMSFEEFYLFNKHHIVGENTFQNLVPMLTNIDSEKLFPNNTHNKSNIKSLEIERPFDDVPFLWKNYSDKPIHHIPNRSLKDETI